jgi:hypothetical protein
LNERIALFTNAFGALTARDDKTWKKLSPLWEREVLPFIAAWEPVWRNSKAWSWSLFDQWATHWNALRQHLIESSPRHMKEKLTLIAGETTGLLAEVAPAIAATSGVTARFELDDRQCLCVTICVDGKCYSSSMDLAPAIGAVLHKMSQWHAAQHDASMPAPHLAKVSETVVIDAVDKEVTSAGQALLEDLVGRHVDVISAGWLSSVRGAIGKTLRVLKPVITTVATKVAAAYGGEKAGAAAAAFAPMLTDFQADLVDPKKNPKKAAEAQRAIAQLNVEAKADPRVAEALRAAQKAVTNTTVAYHVNATATKAAAGDPAAQKEIAAVVAAAQQGDPVAKSTTDVLTETFAQTIADRATHSEWGAKLWEQVTGRGPATVSGYPWYGIVGAEGHVPSIDKTWQAVDPKYDSPNRQRAKSAVWDEMFKESPISPRAFYLYVEAKGAWNLYGTDDQEDLRAKAIRLVPLKIDYVAVFKMGGGGPLLDGDAFPSGQHVHARGRLPSS